MMREYAKVSPQFWTGTTGKALRRRGSEALIVGLYLMTAPSSNMLGLFYQPLLFMAHETGLGPEGASKGLQACTECGFCSYDTESEMVWVHEMASYQIGDKLASTDKRCKGIQKDYDALPQNVFLGEFFDRYEAAFHLSNRRAPTTPPNPNQRSLLSPSEGASQAPSKQGEGAGTGEGTGTGPKPTASSAAKLPTCPYQAIVDLYHELLSDLPSVRLMSEGRKRAIARTWQWVLTSKKPDHTPRATNAEEALAWLRKYFQLAHENDFLMGRTPRTGEHANWKCDLDFLLTDRGMKHVIEKTEPKDPT